MKCNNYHIIYVHVISEVWLILSDKLILEINYFSDMFLTLTYINFLNLHWDWNVAWLNESIK